MSVLWDCFDNFRARKMNIILPVAGSGDFSRLSIISTASQRSLLPVRARTGLAGATVGPHVTWRKGGFVLPAPLSRGQCLDLRSRLGWTRNYTTKMSVNLTSSDTWTEGERPRGGTSSMSATSSQEQGPGGPPPRPGPLPSCPHS